MELQYKIDGLEAKVDGWKASLDGVVVDDDKDISSPNDVANFLTVSKERQDMLASKVASLEEQYLNTEEDFSQQALMHKAIVDGLEYQCGLLTDENADFCNELKEKHNYITTIEKVKGRLEANIDTLEKEKEEISTQCGLLTDENAGVCTELKEKQEYIITLEEAKERLEVGVDTLEKEKEEVCRTLKDTLHTLSDLQQSLDMLRQQKLDSELLSNEVISAVKKLVGSIVNIHAAKLNGFTGSIDLSTSSWSECLEYASQFIVHASEMSRRYHQDAAEAATPKAKGSNNDSFGVSNFAPQHLDMLEDLKNMKCAIANVMSSPKMTPLKPISHELLLDTVQSPDLYSDLLRTHKQLESLGSKIEEDQMQWEDREAQLQSRIVDLEQDLQEREATQEADQVKVKEEHMKIAKAMAMELAQTRKKVLLLKSHLDKN